MDIAEARKLAAEYIAGRFLDADYEVVLYDATRELDYGWVFFYNSKKFIETDDISEALVGNAPFLVERPTGRIVCFGTAKPIDEYLREYEENISP